VLNFFKSLLSVVRLGAKFKVDVSRQTRNIRSELVARVDPTKLEICHPYFSRRRGAWPWGEKIAIFHAKENGIDYYERP